MQIGIKAKSSDELINFHPSPKNDKIQALKKSPEGSNLVDTTCIKWWRIGDCIGLLLHTPHSFISFAYAN